MVLQPRRDLYKLVAVQEIVSKKNGAGRGGHLRERPGRDITKIPNLAVSIRMEGGHSEEGEIYQDLRGRFSADLLQEVALIDHGQGTNTIQNGS